MLSAGPLRKYQFEFKHLLVLLGVLIAFEVALFFIFRYSFGSFVVKTQVWYQENSAKRMANLTATSLELILETAQSIDGVGAKEEKLFVDKFNIVLSQQLLEENVEDICLFLFVKKKLYVVDNGRALYNLLIRNSDSLITPDKQHKLAIQQFAKVRQRISRSEGITTISEGPNHFHSFVPFVPKGEYLGVLYVRNSPDFSGITNEFTTNFDELAVLFTTLIFLGLLIMYKISAYTVRVKNTAQQLYYEEHNSLMKERVERDKEMMFTKRIYHANHKAEKIMGFIQTDLASMEGNDELKHRVMKYANFISRIIYDMKWYDPPIHSIRNHIYKTDINEVIRFIARNLFQRLSVSSTMFAIHTDLDEQVPILHVNEFVIWEILEPLMQNSLVHNGTQFVNIYIRTRFNPETNCSCICIADDGKGIDAKLLEQNDEGITQIFLENTTTKEGIDKNFGYGCFIAYTMAKRRCGWDIMVKNLPDKGCEFSIIINH